MKYFRSTIGVPVRIHVCVLSLEKKTRKKRFESVIIYMYFHDARFVLIKRKIGLLLIFGLE
jgi:hypothetical protein